MARLGFIFSSLLSLPERVTLWSRIIPVHVREREREPATSPGPGLEPTISRSEKLPNFKNKWRSGGACPLIKKLRTLLLNLWLVRLGQSFLTSANFRSANFSRVDWKRYGQACDVGTCNIELWHEDRLLWSWNLDRFIYHILLFSSQLIKVFRAGPG